MKRPGGEITVKAPTGQAQTDALDLLNAWMPIDNPTQQERFRIIAAKIDIAFLPGASEGLDGDTAQLILKRRGVHNLADFGAAC